VRAGPQKIKGSLFEWCLIGVILFFGISLILGMNFVLGDSSQFNEVYLSDGMCERHVLVTTFGDHHLITSVVQEEDIELYRFGEHYYLVQIGSPEIAYSTTMLKISNLNR